MSVAPRSVVLVAPAAQDGTVQIYCTMCPSWDGEVLLLPSVADLARKADAHRRDPRWHK